MDSDICEKQNYMRIMKKSDICIATTGLHESIGWKMGEYVAAARGIVSEKLNYRVPGNFKEEKNYLVFSNIDECIDAVDRLYTSPSTLYQMKKNNEKSIIPIFFAIDNNYAPFFSVALESIKANSSKNYQYEIYILNNGVCEEYKTLINTYQDEIYHITFVDLKDRLHSVSHHLHTRDYYSKAIYFRLFIADLFPEYDKALYLDADIVVLGDVADLYNHQLNDKYLGVIKDDVVNSYEEFRRYSKDGLGIPAYKYFNSGILVMNLKKFREEKVYHQFLNLLSKVKFIIAPDQDYLNVICHDKVLYLDETWNKAPLPHVRIDQNIKLIHYKLTAKPWHYSDIPYGEYFWKYASQSPFYQKIRLILENYSQDDIENDKLIEIALKKKAIDEINRLNDCFTIYGKLQEA